MAHLTDTDGSPNLKDESSHRAAFREAFHKFAREGDLLFRAGRGEASRVVQWTDGRSAFSHVGLVVKQNGIPYVVHAAPETWMGDAAAAEPPLKTERLAVFLAPRRASAAALYRFVGTRRDSARIPERAAEAARTFARRGVRFDASFDLHSDAKMYCTELVWRAYRTAAGIDLSGGRRHHVNLPLIPERALLLPSAFTTSCHLRRIYTTLDSSSTHQAMHNTP